MNNDTSLEKIFDISIRVLEKKGYDEDVERVKNLRDISSEDRKVRIEAYRRVLEESYSKDLLESLEAAAPSERAKILDSFSEGLDERRKDAELSVKYLALNVTGARPGDTLTGIHNVSRDAVMTIVQGIIPASKDSLDNVRLFPELWGMLLLKLRSIEFFSELSDNEIEEWLYENERSGDYDMAEVEGVHVEVADVGKSTFAKIPSERLDEILSGRITNLHDIRDEFPRKPGSKARRHTLIFFLHWWRLTQNVETSKDFRGPVFDLTSNEMRSSEKGEEVRVFELSESGKRLGIILEPREKVDYYALLSKVFEKTQDEIEAVRYACRNFTPAGFKSLLQKIMRYAPKTVKIGDKDEDAEFVLACTFTLLLTSPGSFVPDIQRFVSGQESAFKRLMISILEDSYLKDDAILLRFAVVSFLSQRLKSWRATKRDYLIAIEASRSALTTSKYYRWNISEGESLNPYVVSAKAHPLENVSALLDEIRSFQSDIGMVRSIADAKGTYDKPSEFVRPEGMGIEHCIDHHWAPEIAYYLPMDIVRKYAVQGSKPFSEIFANVFRMVTGVNSRKREIKKREIDDEDVRAVKRAQILVRRAKQNSREELRETNETYELRDTLDVSWIAGMVGVIDPKGKPAAMVTMRPEDPYQFVALRKPSRGMKDGTLSDERTEDAIERTKRILREKGATLKSSSPPIPGLDEYRIFLDDDGEYIFERGSDTLEWNELSKVREELPIVEATPIDLAETLKIKGEGIQIDAFSRFEKYVKRFDTNAIRRALSYVSANRGEIEVSRLSKDGGGTLQAVSIDDVAACQILLMVSLLFPSALERLDTYSSRFRVKMYPLLWRIRDLLREASSIEEDVVSWKPFKDTSKRVMRSYQTDSLNEMIRKHDSGRKGHFLWLNVGLGKSKIALEYLKYLNGNKELPKYVIWALPKSALKSILREIEYFEGLEINLLLPIQAWKKHPEAEYVQDPNHLVEGAINVIEHDHLRKIEEHLIDEAPNTLFIIDEVHKALNDTKRTNVALEISRLSKDFVAMTGTPVVDSNTYKLIWWLEQLVDFEVNERNFWVAANGMIAKRVNTGVAVDKQDVLATFTEREKAEYLSLIPTSIGGKNPRSSPKEIQQAFEVCYAAADRMMIALTLDFLKKNKGVMLVARNTKHQDTLRDSLIRKGLREKEIFVMTKDESIFLTDDSVESGDTPDYKVVITTIRKSEGYSITRMRAMVTSVYPSAQSTREQLEGRINRLSQKSKVVHYRTVHIGILTYVLEKHKDAASLSAVLSALADEV